MNRRFKMFGVALSAAAVVASLGAGAVFGGEITGNGDKQYFSQGHSICKFSGLNDDPDAAFPEGGRTQSYGQLVRVGLKELVDGFGGSPGVACNPTTGSHE